MLTSRKFDTYDYEPTLTAMKTHNCILWHENVVFKKTQHTLFSITVAQWKRDGLISRRSQDRNLAAIITTRNIGVVVASVVWDDLARVRFLHIPPKQTINQTITRIAQFGKSNRLIRGRSGVQIPLRVNDCILFLVKFVTVMTHTHARARARTRTHAHCYLGVLFKGRHCTCTAETADRYCSWSIIFSSFLSFLFSSPSFLTSLSSSFSFLSFVRLPF